MTHHHGHNRHSHQHPTNYNRAFIIGTVLNVVFVAIEGVFGFLALLNE